MSIFPRLTNLSVWLIEIKFEGTEECTGCPNSLMFLNHKQKKFVWNFKLTMKVSLSSSKLHTHTVSWRFVRKCQTFYNEPNNTSCSFQSLHKRKIIMLLGGFYVNPVFCVNYCTVAFLLP